MFRADPLAPSPVCLVHMPYGPIVRPSIGLSILKSVLAHAGISSQIVYGNILFAEEIGLHRHELLGTTFNFQFAAEWTFSAAAFPDFQPDHERYFEYIGRGLDAFAFLTGGARANESLRGYMWRARSRAHGFIDRLAKHILRARPRIVGCSSMFQQHCASLALLRRLKELEPAVRTVMGGPNCEASMGVALHQECPFVDYVCSGESEDAFLQLCQRILEVPAADGRAPRSLLRRFAALPDGVVGPEHRAQGEPAYAALYADPPRARLEDMDRSPVPDYDDYFAQLEAAPFARQVIPSTLVETSRGCWWGEISHCTFCGLNGKSMGYRAKSAPRVIGELQQLADRYGIKRIEVVDNILDLEYFKTVLPELARAKLGYEFFFETKANLSRAHLELLAEAGVFFIQPGIESLDDELLKALAKGATTRINLQLLKWAQEQGIRVNWLMLYNIPGEADDKYVSIAEWLPLIAHLQPPGNLTPIQFDRFSPYQMRPADFNLQLKPAFAYQFIYPWSAEQLERFAYFWEDHSVERDFIDGLVTPKRLGLRLVESVFRRWSASWALPTERLHERPRLVVQKSGEDLVVTDTRSCRVVAEHRLSGLGARIYEACDQARTRGGLIKELAARAVTHGGWEALAPIIARLVADKLLLAIDDWYFSLAVNDPVRELKGVDEMPYGQWRWVEPEEEELASEAEQYVLQHALSW